MVKLSVTRLYCALVALAVVSAQDNPSTPVNQKSTLPEPYKLTLWTTDKTVTAYVNDRSLRGKIDGSMPEPACWRPTPTNEQMMWQCIGDVAINKVNDETVLFEIQRDHWTADTYQQCRLSLTRVPVEFHGAFTIKDTEGLVFEPAPGDQDRVEVVCDPPKKD